MTSVSHLATIQYCESPLHVCLLASCWPKPAPKISPSRASFPALEVSLTSFLFFYTFSLLQTLKMDAVIQARPDEFQVKDNSKFSPSVLSWAQPSLVSDLITAIGHCLLIFTSCSPMPYSQSFVMARQTQPAARGLILPKTVGLLFCGSAVLPNSVSHLIP